MPTYTGIVSISGIILDGRARLNLTGGVLARNFAAEEFWDLEPDQIADVVPPGQTDLHLRMISRWVLACEIETTKPTLSRIKDYLEKVSLPLRIGSPATVALGGIKLAQSGLEKVLSEGLNQPAPVKYGLNRVVHLNNEVCGLMEIALPHLTYRPRFAVPLVHYLNAFYEAELPQAALKYLLALEAMFDPDGVEGRGRNQRVAERSSTFAATSADQKRKMKKVVLDAYTHRASLLHGETRKDRLESANNWFTENEQSLRVITSWSVQRVLGLNAIDSKFDPSTYLDAVPVEHRKESAALMRAMPLCWATTIKEYTVFNPMMWEASGASIEYPATGGVTIEFPGT